MDYLCQLRSCQFLVVLFAHGVAIAYIVTSNWILQAIAPACAETTCLSSGVAEVLVVQPVHERQPIVALLTKKYHILARIEENRTTDEVHELNYHFITEGELVLRQNPLIEAAFGHNPSVVVVGHVEKKGFSMCFFLGSKFQYDQKSRRTLLQFQKLGTHECTKYTWSNLKM